MALSQSDDAVDVLKFIALLTTSTSKASIACCISAVGLSSGDNTPSIAMMSPASLMLKDGNSRALAPVSEVAGLSVLIAWAGSLSMSGSRLAGCAVVASSGVSNSSSSTCRKGMSGDVLSLVTSEGTGVKLTEGSSSSAGSETLSRSRTCKMPVCNPNEFKMASLLASSDTSPDNVAVNPLMPMLTGELLVSVTALTTALRCFFSKRGIAMVTAAQLSAVKPAIHTRLHTMADPLLALRAVGVITLSNSVHRLLGVAQPPGRAGRTRLYERSIRE